jgi:CRISPR-associated endoribonuclease Cas6
MLHSLVLKLQAQNDAVIPAGTGHLSLALFMNLIRQVDAVVSLSMHSLDGLKPYTVSALQGDFRSSGRCQSITAGQFYTLRYTLLNGTIPLSRLRSCLKKEPSLRLDQAVFKLAKIISDPGLSPLAGFTNFKKISEQAGNRRTITLKFTSPTAFRSDGKRNAVFPNPALVLGSYLNKWNSFSPHKFAENIKGICEAEVVPSAYHLETTMLDFGSYRELGFTGWCTFLVSRSVPEDIVVFLNALADFSFYCGTGAKTTMGMGQTGRV